LFRCVWETIQSFSADPRQTMQAKTGMIAILHTWNQKMEYHPHLHCILPSGGIDADGAWKTSRGKTDFLFSVQALSDKFKKKFLILLTASFDGATQVMEYLGRYTHRIAISNHRIIKVTATHVTFRYLDRCKQKTASQTLTGEAFVLQALWFSIYP